MSQGDGTDRPADATAGAWAAAAVVLALGALVFGVVAELHAHDLGNRVSRLEAEVASPHPPSGGGSASGATTTSDALQPADPQAAQQAIATAFATVYDGSKSSDDRLAYVDDPDGVLDALNRATSGSLATVTQNLQAEVSRVTFTSSVTATVAYSLTAAGQSAQRLGSARLVGDTWKVSRATVCADLADAGAACSS